MVEQIIEHIKEHELNKPSRAREYVYRRAFLCSLLRKEGLTFQNVADIMKRNHATICNAMKLHKNFIATKDKIYLSHIKVEMDIFDSVIENKRDIYDDILRVNNTTDLAIIKRRIANNEYY